MSNKVYLEFEGFDAAIARLNKLRHITKHIKQKKVYEEKRKLNGLGQQQVSRQVLALAKVDLHQYS